MDYEIIKNYLGEETAIFPYYSTEENFVYVEEVNRKRKDLSDGEIYVCHFKKFMDDKDRPGLIIKTNGQVLVMAFGSTKIDGRWKDYDDSVLVEDWDVEGLDRESYAITKAVYTLDDVHVNGKFIGTITENDYDRIVAPIKKKREDDYMEKLLKESYSPTESCTVVEETLLPYKCKEKHCFHTMYGEVSKPIPELILHKGGKNYRVRAELLCFKEDKILLTKLDKVNQYGLRYKLPGGGIDKKGEHIEKAATRECEEECRIVPKNVKYTGIIHDGLYEKIPNWHKETLWRDGIRYDGYMSFICTGEYDKDFTGYVKKMDRDSDGLKAKFYSYSEVKDILDKDHKKLFEEYLKGEATTVNESVVRTHDDMCAAMEVQFDDKDKPFLKKIVTESGHFPEWMSPDQVKRVQESGFHLTMEAAKKRKTSDGSYIVGKLLFKKLTATEKSKWSRSCPRIAMVETGPGIIGLIVIKIYGFGRTDQQYAGEVAGFVTCNSQGTIQDIWENPKAKTYRVKAKLIEFSKKVQKGNK